MRELRPPTPDDRCGQYAGYNRHIRRGEAPCGPCRAAATTYNTTRRRNRPDVRAAENTRRLARNRALSALADNHPAEYQTLYHAELTHLTATTPPDC